MLNSEYKLSESSVKPPQLAKSYQKTLGNHGIHCPILILVPSETLTAITSYLDPPSLFALAVVNIYLNGHVKDDNTWRRAFFYQFLGIGPENDLDDNKALLLKRTEGSWRNEFTVRYKLKRRWERSRNAVTTHIPLSSPISSMHVMPSHALLTSSIRHGTVARSLPLTGRILPGYLDASGRTRVGNGNPNPELSTCAISSDGGTAKIVWGTRAGDVLFMIAPRVMDGSRRDTSFRRCDFADRHNGSVLDVQWAANVPTAALAWVVVTASADGRVKLWDAKSAVCQWTSQRTYNTVIPDPCIKVAANGACIAAVMKSGEIHVWTGFALGSMATYQESFIRETIIECPISTSTRGYDSQATHAPIALHIDPNHTSASPTLLVAYEHDPFFYRIRVNSETRTGPENGPDVDITIFGDPFFGSTSVIVPYFWVTAEQQASFVFVGDRLGRVNLYAWDADNPFPNSDTTTTIQPVRKFEAHPDSSSITALTWSPHTLITGSARGSTHVFDALSFRHLRSFASPIPKTRERHQVGDAEAETERERRKVKQIIVGNGPGGAALNLSSMEEDRDLVFISVGERVMAWKAGPVSKHVHGGVRGRHMHESLGKKKRVGYAKYLQQLEVDQTILESRHDHQLMLEESRYNKSHTSNVSAREREREQRERLEHLGLSEGEAVEYVLMLSRDEANADVTAETGSGASDISETHLEREDQGVFEGDFDTEHNTDDDDDDDRPSFTHSTAGGSRRSSTSSTSIHAAWSSSNSSLSSSPASLSSRSSHSNLTTVTRTIAMRRSIPRPIPSSSNEKIQVSPPFKAEPMEAGKEWLVDYNAVGSGFISTSGDTNTSMGPEMEAHIFPPIRNARNEVQDLQNDDEKDEKVRKKDDSKGKTTRNKSRNNIEDTDKNMPQGRDKATRVEIPSLTSSSLASTSARNIPLNYGQRTSNTSNFSSPSTSGSPNTAPRNAWTSGGPSLSARISPSNVAGTGSLHQHYQQQGRRRGANSNMDMDEDLKLAIELSLVEARSRGEDV